MFGLERRQTGSCEKHLAGVKSIRILAVASADLAEALLSGAVSSVVEHYLDTVGVTGSNPVSRTISNPHRKSVFAGDLAWKRLIAFFVSRGATTSRQHRYDIQTTEKLRDRWLSSPATPTHTSPNAVPLRPLVEEVLEKFIHCGSFERGFARVRCDHCEFEYLFGHAHRAESHARAQSREGGGVCHYCLGTGATDIGFVYSRWIHLPFFAPSRLRVSLFPPCFVRSLLPHPRTGRSSELAGPSQFGGPFRFWAVKLIAASH